MDLDEARYWIGFSLIPGIGRIKLSLLEAYFGDLESAWHAGAAELRAANLDARSAHNIVAQRGQISLDAELQKLKNHRVRVTTGNDAGYPQRLKEIYDYPPLLYIRGTLLPEDDLSVGVVGTRRASAYGKQATEEIVTGLAQNRITIVSGLARGIDAVAHRTALAAGGRTVAITGCGLDMVYPSDHVDLARKIMEQGALVTEFPLGTRPKAEHFPQRNRIISGLSLGVIVVEAGDSSGALNTAQLALEQNREVFAVPGSIFSPASRGTNRLIQDGAKLVRNAEDVMEELNLHMAVDRQIEMKEILGPANEVEAGLLACLSKEAVHIDDICRSTGLPIAAVAGALAMLELRGIIRQVGTMSYIVN